jgi:peptidoglycan/LPS O-acetylase OafA/YrhL
MIEQPAPTVDIRPGRLYLPQLDVMRFCAFLSVFFYHGLPTKDIRIHVGASKVIAILVMTARASMENGVALFFLLSAYLITELLRREKAKTGTIHLKMFYIRRTLRIWPLYYLAVGIGLVLSLCSLQFRLGTVALLTFAFFLKNWDVALRGWMWNPIYVLWTVSSEEQFYLLWPLMQKLLDKRRLLLLCVFTMVVVPLVTFWPGGVFVRNHTTQIIFLFIYFPLGGILAEILQGTREQLGFKGCLGLFAAGWMLWLAGTYVNYLSDTSGGSLTKLVTGNFLVVPGTVLIFLAFLKSDPGWSKKSLIYLGKISYGLYVYHVMMLQLAGHVSSRLGLPGAVGSTSSKLIELPFALGLTVAVSVISYEFFEKRFLVLKDRFAIIHSRAA